MKRLFPLLITAALGLSASACKTSETTTPNDANASGSDNAGDNNFEGREVVANWEAEIGDVTICPISGKKFEVDEKAGHLDYQGYTFVFCCAGDCLDKVKADPGKYLDALVVEAGGPASDPDPEEGGAIDDGPDQPEASQ